MSYIGDRDYKELKLIYKHFYTIYLFSSSTKPYTSNYNDLLKHIQSQLITNKTSKSINEAIVKDTRALVRLSEDYKTPLSKLFNWFKGIT